MEGSGLILAFGLALIHAGVNRLNALIFIPEHRWLSFAGGVSIAYVFVDIFPHLSHFQEQLDHSGTLAALDIENSVYIASLFGLLVFYGLDILAINSRQKNRKANGQNCTHTTIFWIHLIGFAVLNLVFGYLMQELSHHSLVQSVLFFIAIALHFFVADRGLWEHNKTLYNKRGRWILTVAILVGAIIGQTVELHRETLAIIWSFLAGSLIMNILKRELPDEQTSCFWSFVVGVVLYAGLIFVAES